MKRDIPFPEIPREEYDLRLRKIQKKMKETGVDALLLFAKEDLTYFTGFRKTWYFPGLHGAIVPQTGSPILILPQICHVLAMHMSWVEDENILPWGGAEHWHLPQEPTEIYINKLKELGLEKGVIGTEEGGPAYIYMDASFSEFEKIKEGLSKATFTNGTDLIWSSRSIKTDWEIGVMREVCKITVNGIREAVKKINIGMTERELLYILEKSFMDQGAYDTPMHGEMMFRGGARHYSMSTGRPSDKKLEAGRQLYFDGGASLKGYRVDMQRMVWLGEQSELEKRLFYVAEEGQKAAEKAIKPGAKISDIHAAAMTIIKDVPKELKSQGVECLYSNIFMGHSIGLYFHEPPWITATDHRILELGMIFTIEIPALDIPRFRELGNYPEDVYLVTKDGYENLTGAISREPWIVK